MVGYDNVSWLLEENVFNSWVAVCNDYNTNTRLLFMNDTGEAINDNRARFVRDYQTSFDYIAMHDDEDDFDEPFLLPVLI